VKNIRVHLKLLNKPYVILAN